MNNVNNEAVGYQCAPVQVASCPAISFVAEEAKAETLAVRVPRSGPSWGTTDHQGARLHCYNFQAQQL